MVLLDTFGLKVALISFSIFSKAKVMRTLDAHQSAMKEIEKEAEDVDPMDAHRASRVSDREDEYKSKR